jgi:hypothetical protein
MKLRNLKRKFATFGVVSALSVLCLSYQNCSRPNFAIDDATKAKVLGENPVFGDRDPGVDPSSGGGRDPGVDPVTGLPRDPGTDPSKDPVTGMPRDPGKDPVTGLPRDPGTDPVTGMPRDPGKDPVTGLPRDPGTDPTKPPTTPRDPGKESGSKFSVKVQFVCPMGVENHGAYKPLVNTGELKAVVVQKNPFVPGTADKVCEVQNVKDQMKSKRSIDITACKPAESFQIQTFIYIVEKTVTSDYAKYNISMDGATPYMSMLPLRIGYAEMDDKANAAGCDMVGDPLLVQLSNDQKPEPIYLTSAARGVMFDILGITNKYKKVQTAWFSESRSENYFLVLPDAKGKVKGIDQMFGDNTVGLDGKIAKQGFETLAKHDLNGDKIISEDDVVFSGLRLWKDLNLDGIAQKGELFTLEEKGVTAIDLSADETYHERDRHGNEVRFKSVVFMKDGKHGLVYDLWLRYIIK